jgi:N-acetylmuramoyl-L-alanine amidase
MVLIYLDAGHGGKDTGAIGNRLKEKDVTLDICKRIQAGLNNYECEVLMSRTEDVYLTLDERTDKANAANADVLISVHINSAAVNAKGFETFIYPNANAGTKAFQNVLHQEIKVKMGAAISDRGMKQENFHMLRESNMKAVLTENLFISNAADAAKLADDQFKQKIADGHVSGIQKFLGLKEHERKPPSETETLFIVQVGAFNDQKNAEAVVSDLLKLGYRPLIKRQ